jgi:hypothetical protein
MPKAIETALHLLAVGLALAGCGGSIAASPTDAGTDTTHASDASTARDAVVRPDAAPARSMS